MKILACARRSAFYAAVTAATVMPVAPGGLAAEEVLLGPDGCSQFGSFIAPLPNGNFVVVDQYYSVPGGAQDVGAVFLYAPDGMLISTLTGTKENDRVGNGGITVLANGNFVVESYRWDNTAAIDAGAVTWGSMTTGVSGVVSAANSLLGESGLDQVGYSDNLHQAVVTPLANGNYVISTPGWYDRTNRIQKAGAVTWAKGTAGITGTISAANSLVGNSTNMALGTTADGGGITPVGDSHYVVCAPYWNNGAIPRVGAVTWCDGATGRTGLISPANSLVGTQAGDQVGFRQTGQGNPIVRLTNGNYVVCSSRWDAGAVVDVGAVTWCPGNSGRIGEVSLENSLAGTRAADMISLAEPAYPEFGGVVALSNGNYAVCSHRWDNGAATDAGAVTWGDGVTGTTGRVSVGNSVTGSTTNDLLGRAVALANGKYAVYSLYWDNGELTDAGAVRLLEGNAPSSGGLSPADSLVGARSGQQISSGGVTALTNGNFVVASPKWGTAELSGAGAATWISGTLGLTGPVTAENSLTGATSSASVGLVNRNPVVGSSITALANGNYAVSSPKVTIEGALQAVTWGNGTTGTKGVVSAENSLLGLGPVTLLGAYSGGVVALTDGDYLIAGPNRAKAGILEVGALARCRGDGPSSGVASSLNSIEGSHRRQYLGAVLPVPLPDGGFVLLNPDYGESPNARRGAIVYGKGGRLISGELTDANSVQGTAAAGGPAQIYAYEPVSGRLLLGLPADNKVVIISYASPPASKISLGFAGGTPIAAGGTLNLEDVRMGSSRQVAVEIRNPGDADLVLDFAGSAGLELTFGLPAGSTTIPAGGSLVVPLTFTPQQAGAVTVQFTISTNSPALPTFTFNAAGNGSGTWPVISTDLVPPAGSGRFGTKVVFLPNGNLVVTDPLYDAAPTLSDVGAVYLYSPAGILISRVTGSTAGDGVGSGGIYLVGEANFVIHSPKWSNTGATGAGAVTWVSGTGGVNATVSAENSLVGDRTGDALGVYLTLPGDPVPPAVTVLPGGNYAVASPKWHQQDGAVTWGDGLTGVRGVVSATNSLVGTHGPGGQSAGAGGLTVLSNGHLVISSTGERGAATWAADSTALLGVISESNSLMAEESIPAMGPVVTALTDGNFVTSWSAYSTESLSPGTATLWSDGNTGTGSRGLLPAGKLLLSNNPGDTHVTALPGGGYAVFSQNWNSSMGAVTVCAAGGTTTGEVSAENSLVGVADLDHVGTGDVGAGGGVVLPNGGLVVSSPGFDGGRGAVTLLPAGVSVTGPVTAANSLVGLQPGDVVGFQGICALEDGNYVVISSHWSGEFQEEGAITWCSGISPRTGSVTAANSLTGNGAFARAGARGVIALKGRQYVVCSPGWGAVAGLVPIGAVTWMSGDTEGAGVIHAGNSITGSQPGDSVGSGGVTRLVNGNYVIASPAWSGARGAVTWADGFRPSAMQVSFSNSLVGHAIGDRIGGTTSFNQSLPVTPLANGHYLVASALWQNSGAVSAGAVTWGNGHGGLNGEISAANSLTGTQASQFLGLGNVLSEADGSYAVLAPGYFKSPNGGGLGIAVLGTGFGEFATGEFPDRRNSVLAYNQESGPYLDADYHAATKRWAVGRGGDNGVTLFSLVPPDAGKIRLRQDGSHLPGGAVIDFGMVPSGQSAERMLSILNTGTQPLQISGMSFKGTQFSLLPPLPAGALAQGMSFEVTLLFTPSAEGWQTATLTVTTDDPVQPALSVQLRGLALLPASTPFGIAAEPPRISPLPGGGFEVTFGAVAGVPYQVQRSFDLVTWENRWLLTADDTGAVIIQDRMTTAASGFYRLKAR